MADTTLVLDKTDSTVVTTDKLKHFDKLMRVHREFTNKRTGKTYKKQIWMRREEYKKKRPSGTLEDPKHPNGTQISSPLPEKPKRQAANPNRKPRAQREGAPREGAARADRPGKEPVGQLKERRKRAGKGQHHGVEIRHKIATDADYALENMLLMQEFQTEVERDVIKGTKFKNMVGFNKPDAEFFAEIMDQIQSHAGLGRFRQAVGSHGWAQIERQIQGRMGKYSNQLADIFNDNNRWRNFKTLNDQFREAKGMPAGQLTGLTSALRSIGPATGQAEKAMAGSGAKVMSNEQFGQINQERRRGPKWKAEGIAKRFDNAKHAAEIYYQMREIAGNPNPQVQDAMMKYFEARVGQMKQGRDLDGLMKNGFGKMNMKQKNQLKDMMRELAPQIADVFNIYKEHGMSLPKGQDFRGKGLKTIQEENLLAKNPEPAQPIPAVKPRPQVAPAANKPAQQGQAQAGADGSTLRNIEKAFTDGMPKQIRSTDFDNPERKGVMETNLYGKGTDQEMFYKPAQGGDDYYKNEIMAYEATKMLGIDSLLAPVKLWKPNVDGRPGKPGSAMMSTRVFAKKLGLGEVKHAGGMRNSDGDAAILDKCNNMQDMLIFDYIIGNNDRHTNNQHIARTNDGGYHALAIDHGYTFEGSYQGPHGLDPTGTKRADAPIAASFENSIKNFDEQGFRDVADSYGFNSKKRDRFIERVGHIREYMQKNNIQGFTQNNLKSMMKEREKINKWR